MKNLSRYTAVAALAGLVLSGCGDESSVGGTPSTPTPSEPSVTESTPVGVGLPMTVTRTGGLAGFDDQVQVDAEGIATVSSRGKETVRCKLDPTLLTPLASAAQQVDWASLTMVKPTVRHPDDMIIAVSANGKVARLDDPKLKPLSAPVSKLLTEAKIPPGDLCKPL
ncbi:hypothetical protein [Kribbella albertanoniae]|uniref:hypothetical protein n=1 Tax=Kribbella albertanoniae TaxID=1266829 RepID=UPI001EE121AA|nr:hypothetical protein [Kribbella albertanoniae]